MERKLLEEVRTISDTTEELMLNAVWSENV
jgi:hypothetical protein